jgi:tetratricopeptide (TPR) repeat protein
VLRQLVERGQHEGVAGVDEIVTTARDSDSPQVYAHAFTAAARLLLAQGHRRQASDLLIEVTQLPEVFAEAYYAESLPAVVRTALALGDPGLAARLVDGVDPVTPLFEHALAAAHSQLAETEGNHAEAAALYAVAAERWGRFGNVPERAYALLGRGRCLSALGNPEAEAPLRAARELFASMGYQPALAQTEELLAGSDTAAM